METTLCVVTRRTPYQMKHPYVCRKPYISPVQETITRFPVTKEDIAMHLGQGLPCVTLAQHHYYDILHESVKRLVKKLAIAYEKTCTKSEVEDLEQDCWYRIMLKLHLYKSHKSKFTTWCWRVCQSVLNRTYRRSEKYDNLHTEMPDGLDENRAGAEDSRSKAVCRDVRATIVDLSLAYPHEKSIIDAMFSDSDGDLNTKIVYREVAERSGVSAAKVSRFFKESVQPFFQNRFKGDR